jgi:hypothetical protein
MFSETRKVFIACAFGAGIGSFVALEISAMFCWAGFLLGGLVGYLSYEWREVLNAIPRAYRTTTNFRFPQYYLKTIFCCIGQIFVLMSWIPTIVSLLCIHEPWKVFLHDCILCFTITGLLVSLFAVCGAIDVFIKFRKYPKNSVYEYKEELSSIKGVFYWAFPPMTICWHLPQGIIFLVKQLPAFTVWFFWGCVSVAKEWGSFCAKFFWNLFLQIHSEMRILCGVDAMLGACVGYFAGSAIVGALAGGVFGVFNYLIVTELCLKRLKLIPIKN